MDRQLLTYLDRAAAEFPERTAFFSDKRRITFGELAQASLAIGSALAEIVPADGVTALLLDGRSMDDPAAMLGTLQAASAYAPLDPAMPSERLSLILQRMQPDCVLADEKGYAALMNAGAGYPVLKVTDALSAAVNQAVLEQRRAAVTPDSPVSILYTSGSTGIPKGSIQTQQSYLSWTDATIRMYGFTTETVFGNQSPFFYANSIIDLYPPLALGASVYMISAGVLAFPARFVNFLREQHVTELTMTPSSYVGLLGSGEIVPGCLPELKWGIMSGECMAWQPLRRWMDAAPNADFWHFYGSTEAFSVAVGRVDPMHDETDRLPVGKPFAEVDILFVDEDGHAADPLTGGEMLVSSPWICAGYHRDPERTEQAFDDGEVRRFKTGDIGRMTEQGELIVLGRGDSQIKHHGYRMEIGEAELALQSIPEWKAGILLYDRECDELCCFFTGELTEKQLRTALRGRLQRYMMPDTFIHLDELPYTSTMKVDRVALRRIMAQTPGTHL